MSRLTEKQMRTLRWLAGDKSIHERLLPRKGGARKAVIRSLIDGEFIAADGWTITEAGRTALKQEKEPSHDQ
ncbi:hypothetical protein [Microvirga arsenatis]|uniref:DUF4224 domain-containing protein n=1 Tax=Microvirga arsenatis TaxID=2692265 RepID=A0ABW9YZM4_9HYPH|nr:hypothetical protein [Microvirga arsenatis]NBJ13241.1 hypothetical protein [Microvirga arsenatis]NBJ25121.1 hypothetical protein [Microvirga arsenatis]